MKAAFSLGVVMCLGLVTPARAETDPFAALRSGAWDFDVVEGMSIAGLRPVREGARARCRIDDTTTIGTVAREKLVCEPAGTARPTRLDAAMTQTLYLVLDDAGVRQVFRGLDDPAQLADRSNARAFTFPTRLPAKGAWTHDVKAPDGARALVTVRLDAVSIGGKRDKVWVSDATYWAAPVDGKPSAPERGAAAFAPGKGPALLCTVAGSAARPIYTCLRLARGPTPREDPLSPGEGAAQQPPPPPAARISAAGKAALDKSSLKADAVAAKVTSAYLGGIRRCYKDLLQKKPAAKGTLALAFTVNAVGKTEATSVKAFDDTLASCVGALFGPWRFPIPMSEYGEPRNARFTLEYRLAPE